MRSHRQHLPKPLDLIVGQGVHRVEKKCANTRPQFSGPISDCLRTVTANDLRRMRTCRCRPGRRSSRPRWGASTSSSAWSTPCSPSRVLIALVGNVNTLMLSVLERTREIGLLRAVGMRRPQVRSESVILAAFGALIGIVVGTLMGLALVSSLRQQGISETTVPVTKLVLLLLLAALLGLVAAGAPELPDCVRTMGWVLADGRRANRFEGPWRRVFGQLTSVARPGQRRWSGQWDVQPLSTGRSAPVR